MNRTLQPYVWLAIAVAAVVGISFVFEDALGSYDKRVVVNIGISMILATSLNLINGFTGQFSLGHAGFMAVGAYAAAAFTTLIIPEMMGRVTGGAAQEVVLFGGLLMGGIVSAFVGLIVGIPSLRLRGDYLAIVTLGFGEMIRVIIQNLDFIGGSLGMSLPRYTTFLWVFLTLVIVVFIVEMLIRSTYGKGFLAVRDDEVAAEAMGVDTTRYKVVAFVVGAFFAGVAGGLYAHYNQLIRPEDFNFLKSVEIVVMVILGGMGSTYGVLLAAALLTYLPEALRGKEAFGIELSSFRMPVYALVLIILMLTRPQGLFGDFHLVKRIRRWITDRQQKDPPTMEA